ncbi:hypothetical protein PoB_005251000 [Plakobranchus ocellatus]|uniref:Uncharacterized protein n=1 Tax=Plakobranchus ocellatus TaxID=259542 RepID=A0AAV4C008_9GAST|nr:hypothetical protein PoB_005251000 [Plakobranchus ocellatus]
MAAGETQCTIELRSFASSETPITSLLVHEPVYGFQSQRFHSSPNNSNRQTLSIRDHQKLSTPGRSGQNPHPSTESYLAHLTTARSPTPSEVPLLSIRQASAPVLPSVAEDRLWDDSDSSGSFDWEWDNSYIYTEGRANKTDGKSRMIWICKVRC